MTRSSYKKLRAIQWLGSALMLALVVCSWLNLVSVGFVVIALVLVGLPTALAAWLLRDQNFTELPE